MKKTLLHLSLLAAALFANSNHLKAQIYAAELPLSDGSTSGNSRGPNAAARAQITEALYTKAELYPVITGAQLVGIGFSIPTTTNNATAALGNIKVYLQNTTDVTNTKPTSWATTTAPMTVAYNGTIAIPATSASTATSVIVPLTTPFNYTGSGLYLAYEYSNPTGAISTISTTYDCNTSLVGGLRSTGAISPTTIPTTNGALSNFRPAITWYFRFNGVEIGITSLDLPSNKVAGTTYPVNISLANYGTTASAAGSLTLTIGGVPTVISCPAIAAGGTGSVSASWTPATPILRTKFFTTLGYTGDVNPVSDTLTTYQYAFKTTSLLKEDFNDTNVVKNSTTNPFRAILTNGWTTINNDGGTVLGPWFIGGADNMVPFDGNQSLNDNFNTANGLKIDDWLVSPLINTYCADNTDSLMFYIRSASPPYADSLEIRLSPTGGATVNDFSVLVQYVNVPKTDWTKFRYKLNSFLPNTSTQYRVAFRYLMGDGGSAGNNSLYIGIDGISVDRTSFTVAAAASQSTLCGGSSVTLTGSGASSYSWTGGVTNGVAFIPSTSNTYTVTGTGPNGCTNTATTSVGVTNLTVTANAAPTSVCPGGNTTLTGGGATNYVWTGGITNGVAFSPSTSGVYTVTGSDGNGCSNTASVAVTVVSTLTVTANASSVTVCNGSPLTLTGGGASTYTWTSGVNNGVAFVPTGTNSYTVMGSSGTCTGSAVVTVSVNAVPTVTASTTSSSVCAGSSVTLNGGGATTYSWSNGVTNNVAFNPTNTNTYTVSGTTNGCTGTATISVLVTPNPVVTASTTANTICTGNSITLTGGGATTYSWTGGVSNGVAFNPATSSNYTVTGTSGSCSGVATVSITVSPCTSIETVANTISLSIYPNPTNGDFTIAISGLTQKLSMEIVNGLGQVVQKENIVSEKQTITTELANGIYFIKLIESGKVLATQKIIKH